ncbi:MAG: hypothetical protein ACE5JX_13810 [Acidobacteriota bacterium]
MQTRVIDRVVNFSDNYSGHPLDIELDLNNDWMYWGESDSGDGNIKRARLDGSGLQTISTFKGTPYFFSLNVSNGYIYCPVIDLPATRIYRITISSGELKRRSSQHQRQRIRARSCRGLRSGAPLLHTLRY